MKRIIVVVACLILIAGGVIYATRDKTPESSTTAPPAQSPPPQIIPSSSAISVEELYAAFQQNPLTVTKYKGKIIEMTGTINDINMDGYGYYLELGTGNSIRCYSLGEELLTPLHKGQKITLEGEVIGIRTEPFLGFEFDKRTVTIK